MHRRINVSKSPFVGRQLPVWVHVPLAQHQRQLALGKIRIDDRKPNAMKCEIPGGEPWVLPLVWHGEHISVVEVGPTWSCDPYSAQVKEVVASGLRPANL